EVEMPTIKRVLQVASDAGTPVIFNYAPARAFEPELLDRVHTLVVNENEASRLAGARVDSTDAARGVAERLIGMGPHVAIITLGAAGSVVATREANGVDVRLVEAYPVEAVDTTAAGDTYCGCLAVALAEGKSLDDAVRFAGAGAALSVQKMGAQPSTPYRAQIDGFLKERDR
ncbi:MAG: PfkB family carbohydrate kinase, partial [Spirochaetota bacterium]